MHDDMVERVSLAIRREMGRLRNPTGNDLARAAIEAMREPTEDMCDEAECATPFSFEAMWKAAIDEALVTPALPEAQKTE